MKYATIAVTGALALGLLTAQARAGTAPVKTDAPAGTYTLDKSHASLLFRVSHMGFSNYTARFKHFDATLVLDPKQPEKARVTATVDPRSLDLNEPPAGFLGQLLGKDWLDAAKYPKMTFHTTRVELTSPNSARIAGDFTLHGIVRPVTLDATFNGGYAGFSLDPHARIGFSAHGAFKRSAYGMSFGLPPPGSNMGVGDRVEVIIEAEFSGPAWVRPKKQNAGKHSH